MKISEIYKSVQGEGILTGTESVFVRAGGCNLRCWFCDTPYASWDPVGEDLAVDEILRQVKKLDCSHVVLTGGEPLLFSEMIPLCHGLRRLGSHITIETAGTLYLPLECDLMSISPKMSNSTPSQTKAPNGLLKKLGAAADLPGSVFSGNQGTDEQVGSGTRSSDRYFFQQAAKWHRRHEQSRHVPEVIDRLTREYNYQLKFVIDSPEDCDEVDRYLEEFPSIDPERVLLMPQATNEEDLDRVSAWLEPYCLENDRKFCTRMQIQWFGLARGT